MTNICAFCLSNDRNLTLIDVKYWKSVDSCITSEVDKWYLQCLQRKQALLICWECNAKLQKLHQFICTSQQSIRVLNAYLETPTQIVPVPTSKLYRTLIEIVETGPSYEETNREDESDDIKPKYEEAETENMAGTHTGIIYDETVTGYMTDTLDTVVKSEETETYDVADIEINDLTDTVDARPIYEQTKTEDVRDIWDVKVEDDKLKTFSNNNKQVNQESQTTNDAANENIIKLETSSPWDDECYAINFVGPAGEDPDNEVLYKFDVDDIVIEESLIEEQLLPEAGPSKATEENITSKQKDIEKPLPEPKFTVQWVSKEQAQVWYTSEREQERAASPTHMHLCDKCQRGFAGEQELQAHVELCHSETAGIYMCHVCQYRFAQERFYRNHLESHFLHYKCKKCSYETRTSIQMHEHIRTEHVDEEAQRRMQEKHIKEYQKARTCTRCKHELTSPFELRAHLSVCTLYNCSDCDASFGDYSSYYCHLKTHPETFSEEAEMYCEPCEIKFKSLQAYKRHMNYSLRHVSRDDYEFQCEHCNTKYPDSSRLRIHVATVHLKQGRFQCEICPKSYNRLTEYRRHRAKKHNIGKDEELNKTCDKCGKTFYSNSMLEDHMRTHTGEKPYKCEFCESSFGNRNILYGHCKFVHKKKIYMGKARVSKGEKYEDFETKTHVCQECGKSFIFAYKLKDHVDYVHKGRTDHVCKYCDKMFSTRMGLALHNKTAHGIKSRQTKEKDASEESTERVKCKACEDTFRHKSALYRHYKSKHLNLKRSDRVRIRNLTIPDKEVIVDLAV